MKNTLLILTLLLTISFKDQVSTGASGAAVSGDTSLTPSTSISKIDSTQASGAYNAGEELIFRVYFDKVVKVIGTPQVEIDFGNGVTRSADYESGSDSSVLQFSYTVQPGEFTSKLATTQFSLNGGSIEDTDNKAVDINLPTAGAANAFDQQRSLSFGLSDNFDDNKLSTQWTMNDRDNFDLDQNGSNDDDFALSFFERTAAGNGTLTLNGRGRDVWQNDSEFTSVYLKNQSGDFDYSVKIMAHSNTNAWTKSGIMISNDHEDLSQSGTVFCATTQSNKLAMQWDSNGDGKVNRSVNGVGSSTLPVWIRMKKVNDKIECFYKFNEGDAWSPHTAGIVDIQSGSGSFDVGLFSTSHNSNSSLTVQFDDFKVEN
jgi:regulation of enolase protein 1 (concanavalin A-like superfamily)